MSLLRSCTKFVLTITGLALIGLSIMFIYYTYPYVENEALQYLLEDKAWLTKAFVYGVGGFLMVL